jgi:hypothetical protein
MLIPTSRGKHPVIVRPIEFIFSIRGFFATGIGFSVKHPANRKTCLSADRSNKS